MGWHYTLITGGGRRRPRTRQDTTDPRMTFIDKTRKTSRPVHPLTIAGTWVAERGAVTVLSPCINAGACPAVCDLAAQSLLLGSGGRVVSALERRVFASGSSGRGWGLGMGGGVGVGCSPFAPFPLMQILTLERFLSPFVQPGLVPVFNREQHLGS
jgi:hypothetical protein